MTTITTRVVGKRDSATSILRKLGLKPNMYGLFMKQREDGKWEVDLPKIYEQGYAIAGHTGKLMKPDKPKAPRDAAGTVIDVPKPGDAAARKPKKEPKAPKEKKPSISSVAEVMILEGKTNDQVWTQLKEQFKLGDDKKSYPSWYRCRLKRQGKLEKKS